MHAGLEVLLITLFIIVPILLLIWLVVLTHLYFKQKKFLKNTLTILEVEVRSLKRLFDSFQRSGAFKSATPEEEGKQAEARPEEVKTIIRPEPPPIPVAEKPAAKEIRMDAPLREPQATPKVPPPIPQPEATPSVKGGAGPVPEYAGSQKGEPFKAKVDWELFTGIKLFGWLGGIALFIGVGFLVKIYSELIPPSLWLSIIALAGIGLILFSGYVNRIRYEVLRHTLGACGIGVLYSVVFAATLHYHYLSPPIGFGLLIVVSTAAFVLALFQRGIAISVLGALGAYLTPIMVRTGQGNLWLLFVYLAVVNIGLFQVVRRLASPLLLLIATAGTLATLSLASFGGRMPFDSLRIAGVWTVHLALFSIFLGCMPEKPKESPALSWSYHLLYGSALLAVMGLLMRSGNASFLLLTAAMAGAVILALGRREWFGRVIPYSSLVFVLAFLWVMLHFDPNRPSWDFAALLIYGVLGGLGPVALIQKYGLERLSMRWFQVFPSALGLMLLIVVLKSPAVSFWFWSLILILELLAILISLLFGALVQVGLLTLFFMISGLAWILRRPVDFSGLEFFGFLLLAGALFSMVIFYVLQSGPAWTEHMRTPGFSKTSSEVHKKFREWIAAFPAMGAFILLAVLFAVQRPLNPHPAMATLVCFLGLSLFLARRLEIPSLAVTALVCAFLAQGIWALQPDLEQALYASSLFWSGALFCIALLAPYIFFRRLEKWSKVWMAWALFEALQGLFLIWASDHLWPRDFSGWSPLVLALIKLPVLSGCISRLHGRPERNGVLAFHGGAILFYISSVPVMLLDQGWIGLTLVLEACGLLWLNRRVMHEGLRWVASLMAPAGLLLIYFALPRMKGPDDLVVLNNAVWASAAAVLFLALAVKPSGYPGRLLGKTDLPHYFLWLAVGAGFFLVNLIVADCFAEPPRLFRILPENDVQQGMAYSLVWLAFGALLWSMRFRSRGLGKAALLLVTLGSTGMIVLPFWFPDFVPGLKPFPNIALPAYLAALVMLLVLFLRQKKRDTDKWTCNGLLTIFLIMGFMALKVQMNAYFASGTALHLFFGQSAAMSTASAFGWLAYGLGLLLWPKGLAKPFRIAGVVLILLGLAKTTIFPFNQREAFGAMAPLWNIPSLLYGFALLMLAGLAMDRTRQHWPWERFQARVFWGILLAGMAFLVLHIEIASVFGHGARPFTFLTFGSLAHQLTYSLGWMLYSIGLLIVGIHWQMKRVRWAAIIWLLVTALKIIFMDIWRLGGLYRPASLIGFATVGILFSFLYQRYLGKDERDVENKDN